MLYITFKKVGELKFIRVFPLLYIFVASWTNAFALSSWLPITVVVLFLTALVYGCYFLTSGNVYRLKVQAEDIALCFAFFLILALGILQFNSKTFNYILAYFITYFIGFYFIKSVFLRSVPLNKMLNVNLMGLIFVSAFGVSDFILQILFDIKVQYMIPRSMVADAIYQIGVPRVYGLSDEPTYLAWYFNTLGIIGIWWLSKKKWNKVLRISLYTLIVCCYLFTFSGAGIPLMVVIGSAVGFYYSRKKIQIVIYTIVGLFLAGILVYESFDYTIIEPLIHKITFKQDGDYDRTTLWKESISDAMDNPFIGKGLGYYSSLGKESPVNYFLFMLIEVGIFPVLFILTFYGIIIYKITMYRGPAKSVMLISIVCGVAHLITQSLFVHPCLWLAIIFFYKFQLEYNQELRFNIKLKG